MSALPSPSGSGPQRPDPAHGSSRHSHRATESETAEHGDPGDGSWFAVVLRGYDRSQVDTRLADLDHRIHEEIRRAETAERALSDARAQVRRLQEQVAAAPSDRRAEDAGFGHRVERVLQAAEQEATELRERATAEADEIVSRARQEAEDRRTRTEEALLGRASTLDREFTSRGAALDERDQDAERREQDLDRREDAAATQERVVEEQIGSARAQADRILESARADADDILAAARDEAATVLRDAEHDADERRSGVTRDVERLATLRDEVRGELTRVRESLSAELDQEPVASALDETLFGPTSTGTVSTGTASTGTTAAGTSAGSSVASISSLDASRASTSTTFVRSSGAGTDSTGRSGGSDGSGPDSDDDTPSPAARAEPEADGASDSEAGEIGDTVAEQETPTGTLLLGPGRRPGTGRDDDPDSTTIGQIPPISLTSIGVLPFGELGAGRDNARTRTDGSGGVSRPHRGPTRGQGPGRRSR